MIAKSAGGFPAVPRSATLAPRSITESVRQLLYPFGHARDYSKPVARSIAEVFRCLDFLAPHVYPETCHKMPQVDRDAVISFFWRLTL